MKKKHNCEAEIQREIDQFEANVDGPDRSIDIYQSIINAHDNCLNRGCPPELYNNILHRINHRYCMEQKIK